MPPKNKLLGRNVSDQWEQRQRMKAMEESGEPLLYQAEYKPYTERPAYSVGEHIVDKLPYRPPKYQIDKYKKGKISYEELMRPEKILKGGVDFIAPQSTKEAAEIAVLGGAVKTAGMAYRGGKRLMTNIPIPESYDVTRKLNQIINAPLKNKLYAMKYDVPVSATTEIGKKVKNKDVKYPYQAMNRDMGTSDLGFVAHELQYNKGIREGIERDIKRLKSGDPRLGVTPAQIKQNKNDLNFLENSLKEHNYDEFLAIQNYYLRRGLKMPSTPEGFNNPKFLEMFPEYKPVAKEWKRMMSNIMEYEMKDPKTGKMIPYASFKELPSKLQADLVQANFGKSVRSGYSPFGGYSVGKISRQIPGMPKGYKEERMFYEDKSDFNANLGESLGAAFKHIGERWRPLRRRKLKKYDDALYYAREQYKKHGTNVPRSDKKFWKAVRLISDEAGTVKHINPKVSPTGSFGAQSEHSLESLSNIEQLRLAGLSDPKNRKTLKQILREKSGSGYSGSYAGDVARGVVDKMMKPVTWLGEHAQGVESPLYAYPRHIGKEGKAARTLRVFTPKTMQKIRKESGWGMQRRGGDYNVPDVEMIHWYLKHPKSSGYNPDMLSGFKNMRLSPDKNNTYRLTQWVDPSKKEKKFADDILGFDEAVEGYQYTGVKRFGQEAPKQYKR